LGLLGAGLTAWGALAIRYSDIERPGLRAALAVAFTVFGLVALVAFAHARRRWVAAAVFALVFLAVLAWWSRIPPSHDRDWAPEYAVLPRATIDGDRVTLHGVRDFEYRTERDFTPRYEDRTYDLRKLDSVDLVASYWMGEAIAHIMLSFGFEGEDFVAISVETRRERTEGYSAIKGFFKQYELFYVVADERDVIRLRTTYRTEVPEDVYLYRTRGAKDALRRVFLDYLREINALAERPRWYNTLTTNCTTAIMTHLRVNPGHAPMSWKVLLSGYAPQYAWERGALDTSLPFADLRSRSRINDAAGDAGDAPDFSKLIRRGRPLIDGPGARP
jgi:hypothetical protein